jgi:prolyl oligopeptidase
VQPPVARIEVVRDTYFGTPIEDPYRWLEDWQGEEAQAFLKGQAVYARAALDALPQRAALLARIGALSDASPVLYSFHVAAGRTFYMRRDSGENLAKLVLRARPDAPEQVLLDPNTLPGEVHTAIDWYAPSWDGRHVAYGISPGGSEDSTLHVLDVDGGRTLDEAIPRTMFDGVCWLEDNRSFVYNRLPDPSPDAPPAERLLDSHVYLHHLGTDSRTDPAIFGRGVHPTIALARIDIPFVTAQPTSPWAIATVLHGDLKEISLYAAPRTALADRATCPWAKVAGPADAVTGFALSGETLYVRTHRDAPRYQVIAVALRQPDLAGAAVIVPEGPAVIEAIEVVGDHLLTLDMDGGITRMRRVGLSGGAPEPVPLPVEGHATEWAHEPGSPEVLLQLTSWTMSPRVYRYHADRGTLEDTGWRPPSPVDFSAIESHEVEAPAPDGTMIPLSIIHRKGLALDGSNPTLLTGYGSYGLSITPAFTPQMLAWYERGGVYAVAHMRGGGERGDGWHQAGRMLNKERTIGDFIACAEFLIAQGYTRPARLAGEGTSAGGIPSGGALVRRPDLWAAMVMRVAVTNALRFELTENGPPNVMELGSATTEDGFRGLLIIDSYLRVRDDVPYPAVLLTTGANDPRVVVWMATKMAARLQAATSSGKPVLLRVEFQGGHGFGSTKRQVDEELADKLAFLLDQLRL